MRFKNKKVGGRGKMKWYERGNEEQKKKAPTPTPGTVKERWE